MRRLCALTLLCLLLFMPCLAEMDYAGYATLDMGEPFMGMELPSADELEPGVYFSPLDAMGRVGEAMAVLGPEMLDTGERSSIAMFSPTGFQQKTYAFIDSSLLWNRCHLIGSRFAPGTESEQNLFAGTQYLNISGMLPIENKVADYIKRTGNHVLYRVFPFFEDGELVCRGVLMEAASLEDEELRLSVFCYNVQPGVMIDYSTGFSSLAETGGTVAAQEEPEPETEKHAYILNTSTHRFHLPDCSSVKQMKEKNRQEYYGDRETLIEQGYKPCGSCKP